MLYTPKIDDYLELLNDEEVKNFVAKKFNETMRKEKNLRKVAKSLYIFLTTPDNFVHYYNVKILHLFYPKLQLIHTKLVI